MTRTATILYFAAFSALSWSLSPVALAVELPEPIADSDFPAHSQAEIGVGRLLFWDKVLSGNRNISCASCHHPRLGTSDGLSLGIGEGGTGIGPDRKPIDTNYPEQRIPRNSPALWNVGAKEFTHLFADGRVETDPSRPNGFRTPLEDEMVTGFNSVLSAQTMFPVLSSDEMAGHYEENDISTLVRGGKITGPEGAWAKIAERVGAISEYQRLFAAAYPEIAKGRPIAFTDISNAIAAYMTFDFRSDSAPFDAFLVGTVSLNSDAQKGMDIFFGRGGCGTCHSGKFFTDQKFHAMGEPQIGPGKGERFERHQRDTGRQRVTNNPAEAFAFRTPSLRNVTLTAPYGHAGAHKTLDGFIRYHADPLNELKSYKITQAVLPAMKLGKEDFAPDERGANFAAIAAAATKAPVVNLDDRDVEALVVFLSALEDPAAKSGGKLGIPASVPSGEPVDK